MTRLLRRLAAPFTSRAAVLAYHRIARPERDPHHLCVDPGRFDAQLGWLRSHLPCFSLRELHAALEQGSLPRRSVVLTFDDGYLDNLLLAKPLLARHRVPATVFIATGAMETGRGFWWDELASLAPPERHDEMYRRLKHLTSAARESEMEALRRARPPEGSCRPMRPDEVRALVEGNLVEIGAHSVSHPVLSACTEAEARSEIRGSRESLERLLDRPVDAFAYPFGGAGDFTDGTSALVREAGFRTACASVPEPVVPGVDPLALPRFTVRDWDVPEFSRRLTGFLSS